MFISRRLSVDSKSTSFLHVVEIIVNSNKKCVFIRFRVVPLFNSLDLRLHLHSSLLKESIAWDTEPIEAADLQTPPFAFPVWPPGHPPQSRTEQ